MGVILKKRVCIPKYDYKQAFFKKISYRSRQYSGAKNRLEGKMQEQFDDLRLLRLRDIIGDKKTGTPALIPVSRTTWFHGISSGIYPAPLKLSSNTVAWRFKDIKDLINSFPVARESDAQLKHPETKMD